MIGHWDSTVMLLYLVGWPPISGFMIPSTLFNW
uniref:Uncharacterized protein n=1 Tax=Arundo donax TaxID=35708 RepID=A0A0A8Z3A8_ARUDO